MTVNRPVHGGYRSLVDKYDMTRSQLVDGGVNPKVADLVIALVAFRDDGDDGIALAYKILSVVSQANGKEC